MKRLTYSLLTYRLDQIWFPAALWALFVIIILIIQDNPGQRFDIVRAYLGAVLPLTAGMMAAYALLDDPALELRFAAPLPAWKAISERLVITLSIAGIAALSFQGLTTLFKISLEPLGNLYAIQLAWLVPTLALMSLGCLASLLLTQSNSGALFVGLVWLMELLLRGWFIAHPQARYLMIFLGIFQPANPHLWVNQLILITLTAALLLSAHILFKKQERYI